MSEQSPDISLGWQDRVAKLREVIRTCQHTGEKRRNDAGVLFCGDCGRHMTRDDLYNALINWAADVHNAREQPEGHVARDFVDLLNEFERVVRST